MSESNELSPSPKKKYRKKNHEDSISSNKFGSETISNSEEEKIKLEAHDDIEEIFEDNAKLLCFLLKQIILEVTKKQDELESKHLNSEQKANKLLSPLEYNILGQFCDLEDIPCKVYMRLLCRSRDWYRQSMINFKDISVPLEDTFDLLHQKNIIDRDINKESLERQMNLLTKLEIQNLCKLFMFPGKINSSSKKIDLINSLIKSSKSQKSVVNMFKKNQDSLSLVGKLQAEVSKYLGLCVRISETVKTAFHKVILLFSFPHYFDEEEKRFRSQLYMCMNVYKKYIKFPDYKLSSTLIFQTQEDFKIYDEALSCQEKMMLALSSKNYDHFVSSIHIAKEEFKKLLNNDLYVERYNNLEPFLKRFSGGHIYAKLLTKFCCNFKTRSSSMEIIEVAQMLLGQNIFLTSKRGKWYEILSQSLESTKDNKAAAELLIKAHNDPSIDEVQRLVLQLRSKALLKKKSNGIKDEELRETLDNVSAVLIQEPKSIVITGKALDGNNSGFKSVYLEKIKEGKMYVSVEERALLHYKTNGFSKGCHAEGYIVQVLYALFFFDIIYGSSPKGVFQSMYQEAPLDLYTRYFYLNRKDVLDKRLREMTEWTEKEAEMQLHRVYNENINTQCLISWKENLTSELLCEIMKCITMPNLSKICKRLILNYRIAKSGFPDLTLWNPETKKCKFVEVKSPNDKLSPGQKIWLDFLMQNNIDCEVCNVKNISRKLDSLVI